MTKEVLMDASLGEIRLAVLEDGELAEFHVEKRDDEITLGNIYRGRVERVLPGMQSAFVDIGISKNAFLHIKDLLPEGKEYRRSAVKPDGVTPRIGELLKAGQEITVQVVKEKSGQKGPRVTTRISLPGRFSVLLPGRNAAGISRRMEDSEERKRLKELARMLKPEGAGLIIRTAARSVPAEWLRDEINELIEKWEMIRKEQEGGPVPRCLYSEPDFVSQMVREHLTPDLGRIIVNDRDIWERINQVLDSASPGFRPKVEYFDKDYDLFAYYHVESALNQALARKVYLKSGGYLIFDKTEAMTVIDVNSGRYVGKNSLEETAYKINMEAAEMIARQVRLRNIGGIVIIDFIDMQNESHREEVVAALKEAVKRDRTQTVVVGMTNLGLVEMTRKKIRPPLASYLTVDCQYCGGSGRRLSPEEAARNAEKRIMEYLSRSRAGSLEILVHPDVQKVFEGRERENLERICKLYSCRILVSPSPDVAYGDVRLREAQ